LFEIIAVFTGGIVSDVESFDAFDLLDVRVDIWEAI
jgi:hypothetical protein